MNKTEELKTTAELVKNILMKCPEARNSDDVLYYKVCERINPIGVGLPFAIVFRDRKSFGYPSTETVRRTRQKLQAEHPELASVDAVKAVKKENEKSFKAYSIY